MSMIHLTLNAEEILIAIASYVANDPKLDLTEDAEITCRFSEDDNESLVVDVYIINPSDDKSNIH